MLHLNLFTDGSVNPQSKVGYGAYLVVFERDASIASLKHTVNVKRFEQTSSTQLELQTVLWGLSDLVVFANGDDLRVTSYTDSQLIMGLPGRRAYLEQQNYYSTKQKRLKHYELYQEFYRLTDTLTCEFVKIIAHQASNKKHHLDKLFSLVDQASRQALRANRLTR